MKGFVRGVAALVLMVAALGAQAQEKKVLNTDRDKVSYMIGMDVGSSLSPIGSQIDMAAFERAVRNAFEGGKPLIDDATAKKTHEALMARLSSQNGQPPGSVSKLPEVSKTDVALLVGADVGRSLKPVKAEIDLPTMMQAVRTTFAKGTLLLTDEEARAIGAAFGERQQSRLRAETAAAAEKNKTDGACLPREEPHAEGCVHHRLGPAVHGAAPGRRPAPQAHRQGARELRRQAARRQGLRQLLRARPAGRVRPHAGHRGLVRRRLADAGGRQVPLLGAGRHRLRGTRPAGHRSEREPCSSTSSCSTSFPEIPEAARS
jgi:FKBP-type peptidyl-prolyl cis-trans isomerase FkpA